MKFNSRTVKVLPSEWNPRTSRVRKSRDNADLINQVIQEQLTDAEAEILRMQLDDTDATADDVKETLSPEDRPDFFAFWQQHRNVNLKAWTCARLIGEYQSINKY